MRTHHPATGRSTLYMSFQYSGDIVALLRETNARYLERH